jgi:DNA-3-methyladenine glycosylase II
MLGLEADGDAWHEVGRRDAVVGKLQRAFPGFFTAAKPSPYDAAAWGVISPSMSMRDFPSLPAIKLERLQGVARAALDGKLDAKRLRSLPVEVALAELQQLPGVGPWTASHILFRGAAVQDAVPTVEPRLLHGLADAYRITSASPATLLELAEGLATLSDVGLRAPRPPPGQRRRLAPTRARRRARSAGSQAPLGSRPVNRMAHRTGWVRNMRRHRGFW